MAHANYRPHLTAYGSPAYCAENQWIAVADGDGVDHIYFVRKVERPWRDQEGRTGERHEDGSWRTYKPETWQDHNNGKNPCLLYVVGQPHPWYFPDGHESVRVVSFGHHGSDD